MHRKLASILAFLLLCGPFSAQAFDVFQDPSNSGNPSGTAAIPTDGGSLPLNLWVSHSQEFYGWDLRIEATGDVTMSFDPHDNVKSNHPVESDPLLVLANRVDPVNGSTVPQRVGTLTVQVTQGGSGSVEVNGDYVDVSLSRHTRHTIGGTTIASTSVCNSSADADEDGEDDCADNCSFKWNASQTDTDGDSIGDACQCGDVDGDGKVTPTDGTYIIRTALGMEPYSNFDDPGLMPEPGNCNVEGTTDQPCSTTDGVIATRAALGFPPGIPQLCRNANPPAQP